MNKNTAAAIIFSFVIGAGGGALGHKLLSDDNNDNGDSDIGRVISEMDEFLEGKGVTYDKTDENFAAIMNGYLSVYNDKYTYYYKNPEPGSKEAIARQVSSFPMAIGSGFGVEWQGDDLVFNYVEENGEAFKAGAQVGDSILSIDGVKKEDSDEKFPREFFGDDDSICHIVAERDGKTVEINMKRVYAEINDGTDAKKIGDVAYIRITGIDSTTELTACGEIDELGDFDSIIIDLRSNPGGDTVASINTAGRFIEGGYVTQYFYDGTSKEFPQETECKYRDKKIVVLTNEKTASAAEILTALLKQYGGAVQVGTNTFGKGIVQYDEHLSNDGFLHYTAGYYTVGEWECYQGVGLAPDVLVEMDSSLIGTDDDIQLSKALELLG